MNKKAQGHVEVIISFVIFIGFLLFLFVIFSPFKKPMNPNLVDSVFANLDAQMSVSVGSISIDVDEDALSRLSKNCFSISNSQLIEDLGCGLGSGGKIIVRVPNYETPVGAQVDGGSILIEKKNSFYTLYCSTEFVEQGVSDCEDLSSENYELGVIVERKVWSTEKLGILEGQYNDVENEGYGKIKDIYISEANDFGLVVYDLDGGEKFRMKKEIPKGLESYAKIFPVQVVDSQADFERVKASVVVW